MIGPHIIGGHGDYRELIKRWRPRVVLLLDPSERAATDIKEWSPGTFVIGRVFREDGEINDRITANPHDAAEWAASLVRPAASRNPDVDIWQFNNEVVQDTERIPLLTDFTCDYIKLLADSGLRAAIGSFSVGRPEAPNLDQGAAWKAFAPAMRLGLQHAAVLLLHAYGRPHIFGDPQHPDDSPFEWFLQRYEHVVRPFAPPEVPAMPYVYGEYGCDMRGGFGGWKTGYGGNADAYAHDLELAATFLARQPDCLGACIFTLGTVSFHWNDFDIRGEAAERLSRSAWPAHSPIAPKLFAPEQAQARAVAPVAAEEASKEFRSKNRARLRRGARVRPLAGYPAGPELLKRILADGFVPTSRDFTVRSGGVAYVARSATHVAAGEERVYYASKGQPDDVRYVLA